MPRKDKLYLVQERFKEDKEHEDCNGDILLITEDFEKAKKLIKENIRDKNKFYRVIIEGAIDSGYTLTIYDERVDK